jgi:hypothetical protein
MIVYPFHRFVLVLRILVASLRLWILVKTGFVLSLYIWTPRAMEVTNIT